MNKCVWVLNLFTITVNRISIKLQNQISDLLNFTHLILKFVHFLKLKSRPDY